MGQKKNEIEHWGGDFSLIPLFWGGRLLKLVGEIPQLAKMGLILLKMDQKTWGL